MKILTFTFLNAQNWGGRRLNILKKNECWNDCFFLCHKIQPVAWDTWRVSLDISKMMQHLRLVGGNYLREEV